MKRFIAIILFISLALISLSACESGVDESGGSSAGEYDDSLVYYADIIIEDYGTVTVVLDQNNAPLTVENFIKLAQSGFYDGLTFHRIIEGFMMQGGDPDGNGTGGSKDKIKGEFSANGHNNTLSHKRGVISMARSNSYNSASSQFFIVHEDSDFLDGQYAAFGYVIDGMEIVDKVCEDANPTDKNGTIPASKQPVITTINIRTTGEIVATESSSADSENESSETESSEAESESSEAETETSTIYAKIEIKDYGTITLLLDPKNAPITVEHFVGLAKSGLYDGLTFHRIMEGFMMQGGDPAGNGTGGCDCTIKGEFSANGHKNTLSHKRGVISMARKSGYDTASSQFFIVHQDSEFLDGQYAAFGYVTDGMEIVDKICSDAEPVDGNGTIARDSQPIILSITIEEAQDLEN